MKRFYNYNIFTIFNKKKSNKDSKDQNVSAKGPDKTNAQQRTNNKTLIKNRQTDLFFYKKAASDGATIASN